VGVTILARSGILLVDKPQGLTSHDVVARVRRLAGTRKVGHAGTLDPMATGLLILGLNSSTRLLTYLVGLDKEYFGTIRLGVATNTDDAEGEQTGVAPASAVAALAEADIAREVGALTGAISQTPSSVSAIKVGGKRAYALVRAGESVELAARPVTIFAFDVLGFRRESGVLDVDVRVECSSGTYIRALARDLGASLGVGGHLTALRRSRVGPFSVVDSMQLPDAAGAGGGDVTGSLMAPAAVATRLFPSLALTGGEVIDLAHGKRVKAPLPDSGPIAALAPDGRLVVLVSVAGGIAKSLVVFPADEVLA
jgi:tRNA pseudouridine55 synthase